MAELFTWPSLSELKLSEKRQIRHLADDYRIEVADVISTLAIVHADTQLEFDPARGKPASALIFKTLRHRLQDQYGGVLSCASLLDDEVNVFVDEVDDVEWRSAETSDDRVRQAIARLGGKLKCVAEMVLCGMGTAEISAAIGLTQRRAQQLVKEATQQLASPPRPTLTRDSQLSLFGGEV